MAISREDRVFPPLSLQGALRLERTPVQRKLVLLSGPSLVIRRLGIAAKKFHDADNGCVGQMSPQVAVERHLVYKFIRGRVPRKIPTAFLYCTCKRARKCGNVNEPYPIT